MKKLAPPRGATATDPAASWPRPAPARNPGSAALLELFGHKASCADLSNAGLVASCDCTPGPMQDPAVAIGVVVHHARMGMAQRAPLPALIVELLTHHVEAGDPACIIVAEWLERIGRLTLPIASVRRRRIRR